MCDCCCYWTNYSWMCCKVALIKLTAANSSYAKLVAFKGKYFRLVWYRKRRGLGNAACEIYYIGNAQEEACHHWASTYCMHDYAARIENNNGKYIIPTFAYSYAIWQWFLVCQCLALWCLMLQEKPLIPLTLKLCKCPDADYFLQWIVKWHFWNNSWGFAFLHVGQVIPCTALWKMLLLASIHKFNLFSIHFFKIILAQLNV